MLWLLRKNIGYYLPWITDIHPGESPPKTILNIHIWQASWSSAVLLTAKPQYRSSIPTQHKSLCDDPPSCFVSECNLSEICIFKEIFKYVYQQSYYWSIDLGLSFIYITSVYFIEFNILALHLPHHIISLPLFNMCK